MNYAVSELTDLKTSMRDSTTAGFLKYRCVRSWREILFDRFMVCRFGFVYSASAVPAENDMLLYKLSDRVFRTAESVLSMSDSSGRSDSVPVSPFRLSTLMYCLRWEASYLL
jgi:hypothetical protein